MIKYYFSKDEIDELSQSKYVKSINEKTIQFTNEFKEEFIHLYKQGIRPKKLLLPIVYPEFIYL